MTVHDCSLWLHYKYRLQDIVEEHQLESCMVSVLVLVVEAVRYVILLRFHAMIASRDLRELGLIQSFEGAFVTTGTRTLPRLPR